MGPITVPPRHGVVPAAVETPFRSRRSHRYRDLARGCRSSSRPLRGRSDRSAAARPRRSAAAHELRCIPAFTRSPATRAARAARARSDRINRLSNGLCASWPVPRTSRSLPRAGCLVRIVFSSLRAPSRDACARFFTVSAIIFALHHTRRGVSRDLSHCSDGVRCLAATEAARKRAEGGVRAGLAARCLASAFYAAFRADRDFIPPRAFARCVRAFLHSKRYHFRASSHASRCFPRFLPL